MRLKTRYALTILALVVISVTVVASATLVRVKQLLDETQVQSAAEMSAALELQLNAFGLSKVTQIASSAAEPLYHFELDVLYDMLGPVLRQDNVVAIQLYDSDGLVIHDGTETLESYGRNVIDNPGVQESMRKREAVATRRGDVLHTAAPILIGNQVLGGVSLQISAEAVQAQIAAMYDTLQDIQSEGIADFLKVTVFLLVLLSLLGFVIAYFIARGMAQPISGLSNVARRIGEGNYQVPIAVNRSDEIGDLGRSFQRMAQNLQVAHDDLARAKEDADRANAMKSQFLANMSHEIRTPMNGVLGMTDLLMRTELTRRQERFVKAVQHSAEGLLNIINDILDFARIEAGKIEVDPTTHFDLHELVSDVVDLTAESSRSKDLHISGMLAPDVPRYVQGDPNRLRQVLINLIGNAVKFTEKGEVAVRISADDHDQTQLVRMEIADTGIGIEPAAQKKLFIPFEQADGSITRRFGGTGLGLSISAELVRLMGGEIGVNSIPGEGSTFWFTIRLPETEGKNVALSTTRNLAGLRIMIVDGNATSANVISSAILGWNGLPECVKDGPTAIKRLVEAAGKNKPFDLAIIDIAAPGLNGVQMAQRIRSKTVLADLPIIAMISFDWSGDGSIAEQAGINGVLTKPIRQTELFAEIGAVLWDKMLISPPPDMETETGTHAEHRAETPLNGLDHRILLAEDNPVNQAVATEFLAALGCDVELAANGKEAVAAFEQGGFDAILMDCQMPEMDGFAAARAIRRHEKETRAEIRIPIIAVTANAYESDRQSCMDAGMDDYLAKPFNQDALQEILQRSLRTQDSNGEQEPTEEKPMQDANDNTAANGTLDRAALDALAAATPNDPGSLVTKVIGLYLEHAPGLVENIRQALSSNDCDAARSAAHSLKSSSANVGAVQLSAQCKALEDAARDGSVDAPDTVAAAIDQEFAAVCGALQTELAERTKGAA